MTGLILPTPRPVILPPPGIIIPRLRVPPTYRMPSRGRWPAIHPQFAIGIDSQEPAQTGQGSLVGHTSTSKSWTFTNTGGTLLIVGAVIAVNTVNTSGTVDSATYNGVSMTAVPSGSVTWNSSKEQAKLFYLENPALGANTVVVNYTITGVNDTNDFEAGALSLTGYNASSIFGTPVTATGSGTAPSVTVTSPASGSLVVDLVGVGAAITSSNQTLSWLKNVNSNTAGGNAAQSYASSSGSNVTMSYLTASDLWGIVAVEIKSAAPKGGGLMLMGVGA